jgi:hypothetical protein
MTTDLLSTRGDEGSGYVVSIDEFADQDGTGITPNAITWTLSDAHGNIINSREDESITPAASVEIGLVAADTTAGSGDDVSEGYFSRFLLIEYTYDTTINGGAVSDYPGSKEVEIRFNSFKNV